MGCRLSGGSPLERRLQQQQRVDPAPTCWVDGTTGAESVVCVHAQPPKGQRRSIHSARNSNSHRHRHPYPLTASTLGNPNPNSLHPIPSNTNTNSTNSNSSTGSSTRRDRSHSFPRPVREVDPSNAYLLLGETLPPVVGGNGSKLGGLVVVPHSEEALLPSQGCDGGDCSSSSSSSSCGGENAGEIVWGGWMQGHSGEVGDSPPFCVPSPGDCSSCDGEAAGLPKLRPLVPLTCPRSGPGVVDGDPLEWQKGAAVEGNKYHQHDESVPQDGGQHQELSTPQPQPHVGSCTCPSSPVLGGEHSRTHGGGKRVRFFSGGSLRSMEDGSKQADVLMREEGVDPFASSSSDDEETHLRKTVSQPCRYSPDNEVESHPPYLWSSRVPVHGGSQPPAVPDPAGGASMPLSPPLAQRAPPPGGGILINSPSVHHHHHHHHQQQHQQQHQNGVRVGSSILDTPPSLSGPGSPSSCAVVQFVSPSPCLVQDASSQSHHSPSAGISDPSTATFSSQSLFQSPTAAQATRPTVSSMSLVTSLANAIPTPTHSPPPYFHSSGAMSARQRAVSSAASSPRRRHGSLASLMGRQKDFSSLVQEIERQQVQCILKQIQHTGSPPGSSRQSPALSDHRPANHQAGTLFGGASSRMPLWSRTDATPLTRGSSFPSRRVLATKVKGLDQEGQPSLPAPFDCQDGSASSPDLSGIHPDALVDMLVDWRLRQEAEGGPQDISADATPLETGSSEALAERGDATSVDSDVDSLYRRELQPGENVVVESADITVLTGGRRRRAGRIRLGLSRRSTSTRTPAVLVRKPTTQLLMLSQAGASLSRQEYVQEWLQQDGDLKCSS